MKPAHEISTWARRHATLTNMQLAEPQPCARDTASGSHRHHSWHHLCCELTVSLLRLRPAHFCGSQLLMAAAALPLVPPLPPWQPCQPPPGASWWQPHQSPAGRAHTCNHQQSPSMLLLHYAAIMSQPAPAPSAVTCRSAVMHLTAATTTVTQAIKDPSSRPTQPPQLALLQVQARRAWALLPCDRSWSACPASPAWPPCLLTTA